MSAIIKSGNGTSAPSIGGPSNFALMVKKMEENVAQIERIAEIYCLGKNEARYLKTAAFYCESGLVPDIFKNDFASLVSMAERAEAMNCSLSEVLNGGYMVHGKWGWSAEFMVKRALAAGFFTEIKYAHTGEIEDKTLTVQAFGIRPDGTKISGTKVSLKMAYDEGWATKKGNKYETMPLYMLQKRAATFLIRNSCPHVMGGSTRTTDELEDVAAQAHRGTVIDSTPSPEATTPTAITDAAIAANDAADRNAAIEAITKCLVTLTEQIGEEPARALFINITGYPPEDVESKSTSILKKIQKFLEKEVSR